MKDWLVDFIVAWWPEMLGAAFVGAILAIAIMEPWAL